MFGIFNGTWGDQGGFHATIGGDNGAVQVQYSDAPRGPFSGEESEGRISVQFTSGAPPINGILQSSGQAIAWDNGARHAQGHPR